MRKIAFSESYSGIGVPAEVRPATFEDFVQSDSAVQKRLRGAGPGLSPTRRMAELLGGSVSLVCDLGRGSRFEGKLPRQWPIPVQIGTAATGKETPDG